MPKIAREPMPPPKDCLACKRSFTWRKKWERDWEHVKYCSEACKRRGAAPDEALTATTTITTKKPPSPTRHETPSSKRSSR